MQRHVLSIALQSTESSSDTHAIMEAVCNRDNLKKALARVRQNKGSPGIDGMTVDDLVPYLKKHWPSLKEGRINLNP
jgi:RNA-directed DNA polymerase